MESKIVRARMNQLEYAQFRHLMDRLGLSNDSRGVKDAVLLAHVYLDKIEEFVPQEVFERFLDNLKYQKSAYIPIKPNSKKE